MTDSRINVRFQRPFIASACLLLFLFSVWVNEIRLCLALGMVILDGRHRLTLGLRLLWLLLGSAGVDEVGSESGVVGPFALFRGNELRLLLRGSKLRGHGALLRLPARTARSAGSRRLATWAKGRGSGLLRGRRRRKRRILPGSGGHCRLLLFLPFGLHLVLQVLHVVVGVVLQRGLRWLPFGGSLLRGRFLPRGAEKRGHDHEQRRSQIDKRLEVLLQDALGLLQKPAECGFDLGFNVRSTVVLGHGDYPLRAKLIFFLPSSTYPSSITFGMM
ncbi:MAG: hypothetical protein ABSD75_17940 [Terriglobales bacterium]